MDAIGQSFVESAADIAAVRKAAADVGHAPFVIAKIERSAALEHIEEILDAADGIMVAGATWAWRCRSSAWRSSRRSSCGRQCTPGSP